jgi:hypothetical protein
MVKISTGVKKMAVLYKVDFKEVTYFNDIDEAYKLIQWYGCNALVKPTKFDLDKIPKYFTSFAEWSKWNYRDDVIFF